jgi:hypothetical protein
MKSKGVAHLLILLRMKLLNVPFIPIAVMSVYTEKNTSFGMKALPEL